MINTQQDVGFLIPKINSKPTHGILSHIQKLIEIETNKQIVVFSSYVGTAIPNNIPVLHLSEAKYFFGNLFMFDVSSAILSSSFKNAYHKYLWLGNLIPWAQQPKELYVNYKGIFVDSNINTIVQSQEAYDIYDMCWKSPSYIFKEFNYENVQTIIGSRKTSINT